MKNSRIVIVPFKKLKWKIIFLIGVAASVSALNSHAADVIFYTRESDIPISKCDLEAVSASYFVKNLQSSAEYSASVVNLFDEISKLLKDKLPKKSIGEQLNKENYSRFNVLNEQINVINLKNLIESNRQRDVEVMEKMVQVADKKFRFNVNLYEGNPEYFYQFALQKLRDLEDTYPSNLSITFTKNVCSFDWVISKLQEEPKSAILKITSDNLLERTKNLKNRNNVGRLDRSKLSNSDQLEYDFLADEINRFSRVEVFYKDLNNIVLMNKASIILYDSYKKDLEVYGSSNDYGRTVKSIRSKTMVDNRTLWTLAFLINDVGNTIPSEKAKDLAKLADALKKDKKN